MPLLPAVRPAPQASPRSGGPGGAVPLLAAGGIFLFLLLLFSSLLSTASAALGVPRLTGRVVDTAHMLSPDAVRDIDADLVLFGLSGGEQLKAAERLGLRSRAEVFADRSYQEDGSLTPRSQPGAMIEDPDASVAQVERMVLERRVRTLSGQDIPVRADTLCIHGDQPGALAFARRIRSALEARGVRITAQLD